MIKLYYYDVKGGCYILASTGGCFKFKIFAFSFYDTESDSFFLELLSNDEK